jgi:predicted nucleotide-binding protein
MAVLAATRLRRMARRRSAQPPDQPAQRPRLTVDRKTFASELDERLALGEEILERPVSNHEELEAAGADYYTWDDYNSTLLKQRFTTAEIAEEYSFWGVGVIGGHYSFEEKVADLRDDVQKKLRRLQSVRGRLDLYEEPPDLPVAVARQAAVAAAAGRTIFIVHGQAEAPKLAVHGLVRKLTSEDPVILHNQPSKGRTIIEKFEDHAGEAAFAVIILTADDIGGLARDEDLAPRARQNVVFEFGFFVGALGRNRVAVLHETGVELPSDIHGLLYIPLDDAGGWKLLLARELKAAGIDVKPDELL